MGLTPFVITTDKGFVYVVFSQTAQRALFVFNTKRPGATVSSILEAEEV